jgi:hypothetical protein
MLISLPSTLEEADVQHVISAKSPTLQAEQAILRPAIVFLVIAVIAAFLGFGRGPD